jgi:hypothetical protein
LLIVMLVYIYLLRIMAGGMFAWFTNSYLPQSFEIQTMDQLSGMFVFMGACFAALCAVFVLLNLHAANRKHELRLSETEIYRTRTSAGIWAGSSVIGLLSAMGALALPDPAVPFSGFDICTARRLEFVFPYLAKKERSRQSYSLNLSSCT